MRLWGSALAIVMVCASPVFAQNVLRVPEDYETIQAAVDAANAGDTIRVGPGAYCGAAFAKQLTILGEGQPTITPTACSASYPGNSAWGFFLIGANGTTIQHFSFSGLRVGVMAYYSYYVTVEHNTMRLIGPNAWGVYSIFGMGSFWTVRHNDISIEDSSANPGMLGAGIISTSGSGWTVSHNTLTGTGLAAGILFGRPVSAKSRAVDNTIEFNHIESAVINGAGIGLSGQDNALVRNNEIFIPSSPEPAGVCGAWGIAVTDSGKFKIEGKEYALTSNNSVIVNNDTRGTAVGVIILLDSLGGTGNSEGNVLRGNFGTLAINQPKTACGTGEITGFVRDRAISTLVNCDENGACNDIP